MSDSKNNQPLVTPVVIKQSSGRGVAVVALALSLLALGASGFLFVQGQNLLKTQEINFNQKIEKAALGESQNAALLQNSMRKQNEIQAAMVQLAAAQKQNGEKVAAAERAFQELSKGRADWLVDETEVMLNLASQQLLLSGNVPAAIGVLENIESRMSRFDHPELLPVKQAVAGDLTALRNRPYVDISGVSLRLDRLETAVAGLPLVVDGALKPGQSAPQVADAGNLPWWEAAWQKTLAALKGMVEVRRLNSNDSMLMAPEQVYFVRENLRLRLLDARAALMQYNGEVYQSDLNNAEAAVKQYFDVRSPATQSWLKELAELKTADLRMVTDDVLKNSLNAVRNYQNAVRPNRPTLLPEAAAPVAAGESASEPSSAASAPEVPATPVMPVVPKAAEPQQPAKPAVPSENKPASAPVGEVKGARV
ncbi:MULTISPECIES: uroporphyrinogen-III C-methyltransferase [unclassified Neisseria]|uniref:uroporphyrinogen-III C-methyltransferase n=1 Tax=unclassified Neisseria TaxID=2623750 RepID=UPI0026650882|nr:MULTISPECIES: uroporphyrinogen-III C-methyltransferase [unclassified Neisseria]MDO1510456.1 uroporphyrinogen-III C-methyltransferase [Neisseria sp. MVDL19-042950]MDO1516625.1 uroporphyrinogen-III C-methyltransferase [Neisseria sp. MVDL18-041461]MDO1563771.1 uroporphyrinogen-III C-methyltransferase [Neisseria sp. MVDL20-010259]